MPQHGRGSKRQVAVVHGGRGGAAKSWRAQTLLLLHGAKQQLELVENNSPTPLAAPAESWQLGLIPGTGDAKGQSNPAAAGLAGLGGAGQG